jgi:predicted RNA-binding Zn-ribbon protein involved in translation (DUF1610 family)
MRIDRDIESKEREALKKIEGIAPERMKCTCCGETRVLRLFLLTESDIRVKNREYQNLIKEIMNSSDLSQIKNFEIACPNCGTSIMVNNSCFHKPEVKISNYYNPIVFEKI